jgi:quinol-cytochrome oxidoreductase complex cytochrome b subunit
MLYWIWFCLLSILAVWVAYFADRNDAGLIGSVGVQVISLILTWDVHGAILWDLLSKQIPVPDDGTFIHSLSVFAITALPVLVWVLWPLLFWSLAIRYGGIEKPPEEYSAEGAWIKNSGIEPKAHRINAEFADGNIKWNQDPSILIWDTSIDNPISQYMVKPKRRTK